LTKNRDRRRRLKTSALGGCDPAHARAELHVVGDTARQPGCRLVGEDLDVVPLQASVKLEAGGAEEGSRARLVAVRTLGTAQDLGEVVALVELVRAVRRLCSRVPHGPRSAQEPGTRYVQAQAIVDDFTPELSPIGHLGLSHFVPSEEHDHRAGPGPIGAARNLRCALPFDNIVRRVEARVDPSAP